MNKKKCSYCKKESYSSVGEKITWICPYCDKDITDEPIQSAFNLNQNKDDENIRED